MSGGEARGGRGGGRVGLTLVAAGIWTGSRVGLGCRAWGCMGRRLDWGVEEAASGVP